MLTKSISKHSLVLISIVIFAFLVRIIAIDRFPPSLNWDEVSHGYNAYSILTTGRDEWGKPFPVIFKAYGDYKLPVYIYLTAVSEAIFGVNSLGVRLPSVLSGTLLVFFTYLLTVKLTRKKEIGLIAALLTATEPWSFFLSRAALEANVSVFFIVSGVYFVLDGLENKSNKIIVGLLMLGLSVWTYNSARVFVPLLLIYVLISNFKKLKTSLLDNSIKMVIPVLILIIFFVPMVLQLIGPAGQARYQNVQILGSNLVEKVEQARNANNLSVTLEKLLFNKVTIFTTQFGLNYLSHFSPNFLYFNGGDNYQFNVQGRGLLYIAGIPFLLYGVYYSYKKKYKLLFVWLLIAPIAASLTRESPHTLRSVVMLPVPFIFTAIGAYGIISNSKMYKQVIAVVAVIFLLSFVNYLNIYSNVYTKNYSWSWQYGYRQVYEYVKQNYDKYDKILITKKYGEPHEFMLFYDISFGSKKYAEPSNFLKDKNLVRFEQSNWFWVDKFDKFYFYNDWEVPVDNSFWELESGERVPIEGRVLLVTSGGKYPPGWNHVSYVNFLDGIAAFEILSN